MAIKEQESVQRRIAEFLLNHVPFSALSMDALLELVQGSFLKYYTDGERIFEVGDTSQKHIFIVRKGQVNIVGPDDLLIDQCAEGDVFGSRALLENENYKAAALVYAEALVLALSASKIRQLMADTPKVMQFFFGDFSSDVALRKRRLAEMYQSEENIGSGLYTEQSKSLNLKKEPIVCTFTTSIQKAALTMREERVGSIIVVDEKNHPVGIITDTDLRNKVATGEVATDAEVNVVMSQPVYCVPAGQSVNDYVLDLTRYGVHHLCVTKTGNAQSELLGVITDHDILRARSNSAAVLLKSIKRASNIEELQQIVQRLDRFIEHQIQEQHSVRYLGNLMQLANQLILKHTFRWASQELGIMVNEQHFCWLSLGSVARKEQIIRTDFDAAMVVADEAEGEISKVHKINEKVYDQLEKLGFKEDPAGIQANNIDWIKTTSQWKIIFEKWMQTPDEKAQLHSTIFFDLMPLHGHSLLAEELQHFIQERFARNRSFEGFLALNALKNPSPLGFFKNFILENSGEHKDEFDLKLRAMMPIADATRLLALKYQTVYPSCTIERLERISDVIPHGKEVIEDVAMAYEIFLQARARSGFSQRNSGRYLHLNELTNFEKQVLKNAFNPLREIQHMIKPV